MADHVIRSVGQNPAFIGISQFQKMHVALRHALQIFFRAFLALCVTVALPFAHGQWGERYPGDGQKAFGMLMVFFVIGMGVALVYFIIGTVAQVRLQRRPPTASLIIDVGLAVLLCLVLACGGIAAHYAN